jgi:AraC family transcriptional regulator of adaptative response / DNA-3-methyladenine glycosylase II
MTLDRRVCSRARLARDARFDGKFFIGVLSTGIYCRPVCRARTSKESNVLYFPSAAAAAEAGFRPCLRCRPECSPGTPAWAGTRNTVSRALQLIGENGLNGGGVEPLAGRLGIGSRHLRRLFLKHLGATPIAVAQTRRLHFAKKLIDETTLPMTQLALASGFGCVRRFNAAIQKTYHRTPTQIRRLAPRSRALPENEYLFRLHFRPPYHWEGMLDFLAARATPGVEVVEMGTYRRTISLNGSDGCFEVSPDDKHQALSVRIQFGDSRMLFRIIERIRRMFDLNADWQAIARRLRIDKALRGRVRAEPGRRVPGCWDGFELATQAILGQQAGVKRAATLSGRIAKAYGRPFSAAANLTHIFPTPETLAGARLEMIGVPKTRARTIRAFAHAICEGHIRFAEFAESATLLARLCKIQGIGKWAAQYVAMRALAEPDAFPSTDSALLRALHLRSSAELERRAQPWRPWRAYAAMYLWDEPSAAPALRPACCPAVVRHRLVANISETFTPRGLP